MYAADAWGRVNKADKWGWARLSLLPDTPPPPLPLVTSPSELQLGDEYGGWAGEGFTALPWPCLAAPSACLLNSKRPSRECRLVSNRARRNGGGPETGPAYYMEERWMKR